MVTTDLYQAIGRRIVALRTTEQGDRFKAISLPMLSECLGELGIPIGKSALNNIERGASRPSLVQLLGITTALSQLRGEPLHLYDLLPSEGEITLTESWTCPSQYVHELFAGAAITPTDKSSAIPPKPEFSPSLIRATERVNYLLNEHRKGGKPPKRFNITVEDLAQLITTEYKRDIDEEAFARAQRTNNTNQPTRQAKGRQTDIIIREMAKKIDPKWERQDYKKNKSRAKK